MTRAFIHFSDSDFWYSKRCRLVDYYSKCAIKNGAQMLIIIYFERRVRLKIVEWK